MYWSSEMLDLRWGKRLVAKRAPRMPLIPSAASTLPWCCARSGAQAPIQLGEFGVQSVDECGVGGVESGRVAGGCAGGDLEELDLFVDDAEQVAAQDGQFGVEVAESGE